MKNCLITIWKNYLRMNKISLITAVLLVTASSCGHRAEKNTKVESQADIATIADAQKSVFDEPDSSLSPHRLCTQELTTLDAILAAFPNGTTEFLNETTPVDKAFYFPSADIKEIEYVKNVQVRYNYVAVLNRVIHSLEWFQRMATSPDKDPETVSKKDTLKWIRMSQNKIPISLLDRALPNRTARKNADMIIAAYSRFDGNTDDDGAFSKAFNDYRSFELPGAVSDKQLEDLENSFWEWYDKKTFIPEIDDIIRLSMNSNADSKVTDEQLDNMRKIIESEKDIDKRTILALEYIKLGSHLDGAVLLGEIIESGIYTKYLLEAWISWRANVQMEHSPSSFSVIANNYYDRMRVKCIDTIVRHCIQSEDRYAECLLDNLIFCEIVHRMGSIAGNSSFATAADLNYSEFIHPRLLKEDEQ